MKLKCCYSFILLFSSLTQNNLIKMMGQSGTPILNDNTPNIQSRHQTTNIDILKAYSQISDNREHAEKFWNLIFLHLFVVALLQEAHFSKGIKQIPSPYETRAILNIKSCVRDFIYMIVYGAVIMHVHNHEKLVNV